MPKGTQQVHITLTITAETRETPTWASVPSVKRVKCRVLWRLGLGMKKWAMRFPSVALKSVNFCGLVWKERGSVVRSRTGSRGTHWSRRKASQPSCLTKASSSWGGGWGRWSCCAGWNHGTPEEEGVAPAPGDKLGFERRQGAILLPFSSCGGSPYEKAFLKWGSLRGEGKSTVVNQSCVLTLPKLSLARKREAKSQPWFMRRKWNVILGAGVLEGREDGISNIFDHLFFFFLQKQWCLS